MSGPFGWDVPGEYGDEEPSASEIQINPIGSNTVVRSPIVEDAAVQLPNIAATTQVFAPTLESNAMRVGQAPTEAVINPTTQQARIGQVPVEAVLKITPQVVFGQVAVEAVISNAQPFVPLIGHFRT